jgi:hypothetical protein
MPEIEGIIPFAPRAGKRYFRLHKGGEKRMGYGYCACARPWDAGEAHLFFKARSRGKDKVMQSFAVDLSPAGGVRDEKTGLTSAPKLI